MAAVATDRFGLQIAGTDFRFELVVALAFAVLVLAKQGLAVAKRIGLIEACLVGWLGVAVISSLLFSPARGASLKQSLLLGGLLCLYAVTLALIRSREDLVRAAWAWAGVGGVVASVGLVQAVSYRLFGSLAGISLEGSLAKGSTLLLPKVNGTMWEPNIFGSYLLSVWAVAFALSLDTQSMTAGRRWLLDAVMLASCAGIVVSISRADWVLIFVLIAAMSLFAVWRRLAPTQPVSRQLMPSALGICLGIALSSMMQVSSCNVSTPSGGAASLAGSPTISQSGVAPQAVAYSGCVPVSSALGQGAKGLIAPGETSSATGRVSIVRLALEGWLKRPIMGWGSNSFLYVYGPSGGSWIGNLELHVLFDTGIAGLILLLAAALLAGRRAFSNLMTVSQSWTDAHYALFGTAAGAFALVIAYQFTDGTWLGFTWVLLAMLVSAGRLTAMPSAGAERSVHSPPEVDQAVEKNAPVQVTIAIVNWNSGPDLSACIEAVMSHTKTACRVLVVDNGSTDDSLSALDQASGEVRVIRTGENRGFASGVNIALDNVDTPFVLLLNPDAFVRARCVDALLERAHAQPTAAVVGSGLRNPDGTLQAAARNFPSPLTHLIEAFRLYKFLRFVPGVGRRYYLLSNQKRARRVDWVVGACMLLRMAAVRDVGKFDDGFFMYSEELDWCLRAHRNGWDVWFEPNAVATHRLGGSSRQNELPLMIESYRSMYRFYRKYYPPSWTALVRAITRVAMLARMLLLPFRRDGGSARMAAYRQIARL